ncbi:MAG: FAM98 family protein [Blautia sp.]|nr:FAM98 family protein [Lachnoclostridium sp.]MCM1212714.1 FAM98 family protein [Blautia sp.]
MKNDYKKVEQEVNRIEEECAALEEKKRKRKKKMGILYSLFLILAVAVNVGTGIYFWNKTQGIEQELEQEYSAKRDELLKRLEVE